MSWFSSFGHGIARAFTIPRAVRDDVAKNPIVSIAKPLAEQYVKDAVAKTLMINLKPDEAAAANAAISSAIDMTGVFK